MLRRTGFLSIILLALAACGGPAGPSSQASAAPNAAGDKPDGDAAAAISVSIGPVSREALSSLYSTSATLRAERRATITARTRGVVQELLVEEGDAVEAGQSLAELENDEQKIAMERAVSTRDTLVQDLQRSSSLHQQGLISDENFDEVRRLADDAVQAAALTELELSRTIIRAPFAGVIVQRHLDVGATVGDGTEVYDLADLTPLYADVEVPERHVMALEPGQEVRLTADAANRVIAAAIERIAPAVNPETGTVKVTLAVAEAKGVRPGAFVRVDIVVDTHAQALVVPRRALVAEGTRWHLFTLRDDETVQQVQVTLGFEEGDRVEVLGVVGSSMELVEGMPVVVSGAPALTDGARVSVVEADPDGEESVAG